jgi:hypothetical protein
MATPSASLTLATSNAYFVNDSLQGDVVLCTATSNQNFLFGNSNSNAYFKVSQSNVVVKDSLTVGGNMQVPSIQFSVGGTIPTAPVVNLGNVSGYSTTSYGTSNVTTLSLGTATSNDKFSFVAMNNEVAAISGTGVFSQYGQNIASLFTFRNRIINGNMAVDQRNNGTSNSIAAGNSSVYTVDRFNVLYQYTTGSFVYTRSNLTSNDSPYNWGFRNSLRLQAGATPPGTVTTLAPRQIIEGYNIYDFAFGTSNATPLSLSFWCRSSASNTHWFALRNFGNYTHSYIGTFTVTASNAWQYVTAQIPAPPFGSAWNVDSNGGLALQFDSYSSTAQTATTNSWVSGDYMMPSSGTNIWSGAGNFLEITGVQLEKGSVCTPFELRPYGFEMTLCQRYYEYTSNIAVPLWGCTNTGNTSVGGSTATYGGGLFMSAKRALPSCSITNNNGGTSYNGAGGGGGLILTIYSSNVNSWGVYAIGANAYNNYGPYNGTFLSHTANAEL